MAGYLTKRAVQIAVTLFIFFSLGFVLIQSQPGNYCDFLLLNPNIPPDAKEGLVRLLGCDDPMWEQYLKHLRNYATGDFGVSFGLYPRSVISVIAERLPRTIMLFVTASVISFYLGFAMGKMIAWRR
ncbi:MAG: ABC transporter permease, partial [Chloroflexi bacterium]|nr:ABC transporter permease [Chloroflexota bacterium]